MRIRILFITAMLLLAATASWADVVGSVWKVPEAISQNAIPGNVPGTPPDATFTVANGPIHFTSDGTYTVAEFLASGGATCVGAYCSSLMDGGGFGTFIEMQGSVTVTNGQTFTVTHDDGLTLTIGGIPVVSVPGPTAPITTTVTYTGPTGTLPFQLVYGECCGAPAVLQTSLPLAPVPEPSSIALLGSGLAGLAGIVRRKFAK